MNSKKIRRILASNRRSGESIKDTARRLAADGGWSWLSGAAAEWLGRKGVRL